MYSKIQSSFQGLRGARSFAQIALPIHPVGRAERTSRVLARFGREQFLAMVFVAGGR